MITNNCNIILQADGNNKIISPFLIKGNDKVNVTVDGGIVDVKRSGEDSNIYVVYNLSKSVKVNVSRVKIDIDAPESNTVEEQYHRDDIDDIEADFDKNLTSVRRDAFNVTELPTKSFIRNEKMTSFRHTGMMSKPEHKEAVKLHNINTVTIVTKNANISLNDKIVLINSDESVTINLPELKGDKTDSCEGTLGTDIITFKVLKQACIVKLKVFGSNRINIYDTNIIINSEKTVQLCTVGSDWVTL